MDMICYVFEFIDEDNNSHDIDLGATHESDAWIKADSIAFRNNYVDYRLKED